MNLFKRFTQKSKKDNDPKIVNDKDSKTSSQAGSNLTNGPNTNTKKEGGVEMENHNLGDKSANGNKSEPNITTEHGPMSKEKNTFHLICDDSDPNRMVLEKYLSRKNVTVHKSCNGKECISMIEKNGKYLVVWMDIQMPIMNGIECTKYLRETLKYDGIIIGLTGYIDQESVNRCLATGMNHVIGKPIDKNVLYNYVDMYAQQ
ncbi:MAG: putative sensor histidine kinase [Dasosvirus sp.]|uniref:Putative sensor histidine kinase n=1 Tax=Dasosvirus sp. TaxID=2487764 RepID=A0A3G4ZRZ7_9VIRU|nr:MAG: putative sensor histidine kinase [Dasosvirus sp.]